MSDNDRVIGALLEFKEETKAKLIAMEGKLDELIKTQAIHSSYSKFKNSLLIIFISASATVLFESLAHIWKLI